MDGNRVGSMAGEVPVADVMVAAPQMVAGDQTVREAAELMAELDTGVLLVGRPDALDGIITDRDILIRVVARGRPPGETRVAEVMSSTVDRCAPDEPAGTAALRMARQQIRRMPVVDADGRVVGLFTLHGFLAHFPQGAQGAQGDGRGRADPGRLR